MGSVIADGSAAVTVGSVTLDQLIAGASAALAALAAWWARSAARAASRANQLALDSQRYARAARRLELFEGLSEPLEAVIRGAAAAVSPEGVPAFEQAQVKLKSRLMILDPADLPVCREVSAVQANRVSVQSVTAREELLAALTREREALATIERRLSIG